MPFSHLTIIYNAIDHMQNLFRFYWKQINFIYDPCIHWPFIGRDRKENKKNQDGDDLLRAHMCGAHVVAYVLFIKSHIAMV